MRLYDLTNPDLILLSHNQITQDLLRRVEKIIQYTESALFYQHANFLNHDDDEDKPQKNKNTRNSFLFFQIDTTVVSEKAGAIQPILDTPSKYSTERDYMNRWECNNLFCSYAAEKLTKEYNQEIKKDVMHLSIGVAVRGARGFYKLPRELKANAKKIILTKDKPQQKVKAKPGKRGYGNKILNFQSLQSLLVDLAREFKSYCVICDDKIVDKKPDPQTKLYECTIRIRPNQLLFDAPNQEWFISMDIEWVLTTQPAEIEIIKATKSIA